MPTPDTEKDPKPAAEKEEFHPADCTCGECFDDSECCCGKGACEGGCTAGILCVGSACGSCKRYWWGAALIVTLALTVWVAAKVVDIRRAVMYPPAGMPQHSITLSATGKASVTPDTAEVELSVLTEGKTPQDVQRENTKRMNDITTYVKSEGIDQKDIKTATYSLYPKYEYVRGQSNIVGYTLTQSLRVKVRDLEKVGALLEGAMQRGANQVGDVRYFVDDPDQFKAAARTEAFGKVRGKASELATMAGVSLGPVISFSESGAGEPIVYPMYDRAMGGGGGAPAPAAPDMQPGSQDISVTVTVTYELR